MAADLAEAQGAKQATKVAAEVVARHMDKAQRLVAAVGSNFHTPKSSSSWLGDEVEGATNTHVCITLNPLSSWLGHEV